MEYRIVRLGYIGRHMLSHRDRTWNGELCNSLVSAFLNSSQTGEQIPNFIQHLRPWLLGCRSSRVMARLHWLFLLARRVFGGAAWFRP